MTDTATPLVETERIPLPYGLAALLILKPPRPPEAVPPWVAYTAGPYGPPKENIYRNGNEEA